MSVGRVIRSQTTFYALSLFTNSKLLYERHYKSIINASFIQSNDINEKLDFIGPKNRFFILFVLFVYLMWVYFAQASQPSAIGSTTKNSTVSAVLLIRVVLVAICEYFVCMS